MRRDDSLLDGAGGIHLLRGDRRSLTLDVYGLLHGLRPQDDGHFLQGANIDLHLRASVGKADGADSDAIIPRNEIVHAKFSAVIAAAFSAESGVVCLDDDLCGGNSATAQVLNGATERSTRVLRRQCAWQQK